MRAAVIKKLRILIASLFYFSSLNLLIRIIIVLIFVCFMSHCTAQHSTQKFPFPIGILIWNENFCATVAAALKIIHKLSELHFFFSFFFVCACLPASRYTRVKFFHFSYSKKIPILFCINSSRTLADLINNIDYSCKFIYTKDENLFSYTNVSFATTQILGSQMGIIFFSLSFFVFLD